MSFISNPNARSASSPSAGKRQVPLTSSGAVRIIEGTHLVHVPVLGFVTLDLQASEPQELIVPMQAMGRYTLDALLFHDLRGDPGDVALTVRTLDTARGGGVLLADAVSLAPLSARHGLIRIPGPDDAIFEAPHLYVSITGEGSGTMRISAIGTVIVAEDPDNPTSDKRRLG